LFDYYPPRSFRPARRDPGAQIRKLVKTAIAAGLFSLVAADVLANLVQRGVLPRVTLAWSDAEMRRLAKGVPTAQRSATVYRDMGVDGVVTSTIPRAPGGANPLAPCGDE
jgi:hypothetical protein